MRVWLWVLLLLLEGGIVIASETRVVAVPDKAFYRPGEAVTIEITGSTGSRAAATVMYLNEVVTTLAIPLENGAGSLTFTPPAITPRGYGVDLRIENAAGEVIEQTSTAFDVLENWIQSPRYGFLTEFTADRPNIAATMAWLKRYHINGLQFYDWQYRHEALMPPTNEYSDLLGRSISLDVVNELIAAAHENNIAAMPYTAIYGASWEFYKQHPEWALFQYPGKPYEFGDNFLAIMNPAPDTPWTQHLLGEFRKVLEQTAFDGIHIDQYGAPMVGLDQDNQRVRLDEAFPAFINTAKTVVTEERGDNGVVIFNAVRNWPLAAVAPSNQDAVYIEVWEPYRDFIDLHQIVVEAQKLGGNKPVIIAAYIHPSRPVNVLLANALIFASGGYSLEIGEPNTLLSDPYFPKLGTLDASLGDTLGRYFDFRVRYENLLAPGTVDATRERAKALTIEGITTVSRQSKDRVVVIVRQGENVEVFSLVNMLGLPHGHWEQELTNAPTPQRDLTIRINVSRPVKTVWAASPDATNIAPQTLDFGSGEDDTGAFIVVQLTELNTWQMLVLDYGS